MGVHRRLGPGEKAPALAGRSGLGEPVDLQTLRGRPVWVAFFRYTSCVFCSLRIHQMIKRADRWLDDGLSIIGVFQSPQSAVGEFMRDRGMLFPFVGDPTERLYAEWGLSAGLGGLMAPRLAGPMAMSVISGRVFQKHGSLLRIPADFLIEADGTIAETFYGKDIGDHIPFERVDAFVASRL